MCDDSRMGEAEEWLWYMDWPLEFKERLERLARV
jgi:hypothetical protein